MSQQGRPVAGSVIVVGGGFSGSLLAINLLRDAATRVTLVERRPVFGRGTAYSAPNPHHLLNVRAANMSAFPDQPRHFADWCAARQNGDPASFVERRVYGAYIGALLAAARAAAPERLALVNDGVVAVAADDRGVIATLAGGAAIGAATLVLATGNLPPQQPIGLARDLPHRYVADPWAGDVAAGLEPDDDVLLLGTGLTMVDVALALAAAGHRGRVLALSRRGLLPHRHEPGAAPGGRSERPTTEASRLVREVRRRAAAIGWRAAVDELRPFTQDLWRAASLDQRARFLRHLRPWWDIHRHRLAPEVADRIAALQVAGRLRIVAGRSGALVADGDGVTASWRPRGGDTVVTTRVRRVINCTGPLGDVRRSDDPLLQGLIGAGLARPDHFGLGLDVDGQSRLIGGDGRPQPRLFAIGPPTRGASWEIVAVPDIRRQAWSLARQLTNSHWVGGEGL